MNKKLKSDIKAIIFGIFFIIWLISLIYSVAKITYAHENKMKATVSKNECNQNIELLLKCCK